jgi:hypothetical protein
MFIVDIRIHRGFDDSVEVDGHLVNANQGHLSFRTQAGAHGRLIHLSICTRDPEPGHPDCTGGLVRSRTVHGRCAIRIVDLL